MRRSILSTMLLAVGWATVAAAVERAYVVNRGSRSVSIIDTATDTVTGTVSLGYYPYSVVASRDGAKAWIGSSSHYVIDPATATIIDSFSASSPRALALDRKNRTLYSTRGASIYAYATATNAFLRSYSTAYYYDLQAMVLAPDNARLYAFTGASSGLYAFDVATRAIVGNLAVANAGSGAITSDGATLYAASFNTLYQVDTASLAITNQVTVNSAGLIAIAPDDSALYVVRSGQIYKIDPGTFAVTAQGPLPNDPGGLAVHPDGSRLYVTDLVLDAVGIYDASSLAQISSLAVGDSPRGIAIGGCPGPVGDCDDDGVADGSDNCPLDANGGQDDGDGDGVGDGCDNCPADANAGQEDGDLNDVGDACQDVDGDGVIDIADNCPTDANPGQENTDGDSNGDACDVCPGFDDAVDADGDRRADGCDNCPATYNPGQQDYDTDGTGDACDDSDGDGVFDANDNCRDVSNAGQENIDRDGFGDACDDCTDIDHDGFGDPGYPENVCPVDNCPPLYNPAQTDADGDSVGDECTICNEMGATVNFGLIGRHSVKWKPGAAYYNRYPTNVTAESDVCANKVSGRGGDVSYDVVATEAVKKAAVIKDKGGYEPVYAYVSSVITGGGLAIVSEGSADFIDTTGTHPDVQVCRDAQDDTVAASQYFASLPPTQTFDEIVVRSKTYYDDATFTINVSGNEVININKLFLDGRQGKYSCHRYAGLYVDGDFHSTVIINVFDKAFIGDCAFIDNYVSGLESVIVNVVGAGPTVKVAPSAWLEVPILAPERSVQVKGPKNFEEPTFIEPIFANKLKLLGYVCANTQLYDGEGYCGVEAGYSEPQP